MSYKSTKSAGDRDTFPLKPSVNLKYGVNSDQSKVDYVRLFIRAYSHIHLMELMKYEHVILRMAAQTTTKCQLKGETQDNRCIIDWRYLG